MLSRRTQGRWVAGKLAACAVVAAGIAAVAAIATPATAGGIGSQATTSKALSTTGPKTADVHKVGVVDLSQLAGGSGQASPNNGVNGPHHERPLGVILGHGHSSASNPLTATITRFASKVGGAGFDGITAAINGAANSPDAGGIGDVTPPDQGLAVGPSQSGTAIVEFVNDTLNIYSTGGQTLLGAIPAYQVFGLPPNAFMSDPRAYWDPSSGHWFLTMFTVGNSGATISQGECSNGAAPPTCLSTEYIAVSTTTNPFGSYGVFSINTADSANSGNGCPCYGDFDQFGADANGIYISTNEFPLNAGGPGFNGTVIYAMSKSGLISWANGGSAPVVQRYTVPLTPTSLGAGGTADAFAGYHLSPSTVTQGSSDPNTEYFVESNANLPNNATATGLETFALLGTDVLASGGRPPLVMTTVPTESYSELPPNAIQKSGPTPLGTSVGFDGTPVLETDFNAVQEVTYADGQLYAELSTGLAFGSGTVAGAAWFVLQPTPGTGSVSVNNAANGYVETTQNLLYPVIGVNASGKGDMAFAVAGPDMYPSAAYVSFDGTHGPGNEVQIAAAGVAPLDDFSCYPYFGFSTGQCRYGDYSMAQEYNGNVYMATEYIGAQPRDTLANWGTRVFWAKG